VGAGEMRDLTVADTHTYYVLAGKTPVLVHNNNCDLADVAATHRINANNGLGVKAGRISL
jgi:hypothetical protein